MLSCIANQEPGRPWIRTYGGPLFDVFYTIHEIPHGGFIAAGESDSFGQGGGDLWVVKLDEFGRILWQKSYGEGELDASGAALPEPDGGFIVGGTTRSVTTMEDDILLMKLDSEGRIVWQKTYGEGFWQEPYGEDPRNFFRDIIRTSDGGYLLGGETTAFGAGSCDIWILKLDSGGNVQWEYAYGRTGGERLATIFEAAGGGYVLGGSSESSTGFSWDVVVLKLDASGGIEWQKSYGAERDDFLNIIVPGISGDFLAGGGTDSFEAKKSDAWIIRLDGTGNPVWQEMVGGGSNDVVTSIAGAHDGIYAAAASTSSFGNGSSDLWLLGIDDEGMILSQETLGYHHPDEVFAIQEISGGGYILAGGTSSSGIYQEDAWVIRLDSALGAGEFFGGDISSATTISPHPTAVTVNNADFIVTKTQAIVRSAGMISANSNAKVRTECSGPGL